jgi:alkaline phosphatase D
MKFKISIQLLIIGMMAACSPAENLNTIKYNWKNVVDRDWTGGMFWANRLQDWKVQGGKLTCIESSEKKPMRTVHLIQGRLENEKGDFVLSVKTGSVQGSNINSDAATGFLIGAGSGVDYRSAALIHHSPGAGGGFFVGVSNDKKLFIQDFENSEKKILAEVTLSSLPSEMQITISGQSTEKGYKILAEVDGFNKLEYVIEKNIYGNIALVSHPGNGELGGSFWFDELSVGGDMFVFDESRNVGAIITAQHTLTNGILKMNAQLMPIGSKDSQKVTLEFKIDNQWNQVAEANVIAPGYTALLRVEKFNYPENVEYRVVYNEANEAPDYFEGIIKKDPTDKETIVVAGFTGNHNVRRGVEGKEFDWSNFIWFPHIEVVDNVSLQKPDLLFFSGDQVYEGANPTGKDVIHIELDYMYKWYLWCWAYRNIVKDLPTISIPDDHDVYQGNIWGAGGRVTDLDTKGGYVHGGKFVQMVERTQTSHLPDAYDPTPIEQGIGVYYTHMKYGRISFAIIEDRKFKSGPFGIVPDTKSGRPDHVIDPSYTPEMADAPGAKLLGDRQLKFLDDWAQDWSGSEMKVVLSQTIFGNMATHHGPDLSYLVMDFDSNGWPQSGRNRALSSIRKGFGFMLGGDQHLATIVNHGIDEQNDAGWSFCVPSIANFYPRAWMPKVEPTIKFEGLQEYTGEYKDGLGNRVSVYAHTNPGIQTGVFPNELHDRMPGYGILKLKKSTRDIAMECWPRYVNPNDPSTGKQYPGWPKTINMEDNYNRKAVAWLPTINVTGLTNPVVQVKNESSGEIIYTIRIKGSTFDARVFEKGTYTVLVSEPDLDKQEVITGLNAMSTKGAESVEVKI